MKIELNRSVKFRFTILFACLICSSSFIYFVDIFFISEFEAFVGVWWKGELFHDKWEILTKYIASFCKSRLASWLASRLPRPKLNNKFKSAADGIDIWFCFDWDECACCWAIDAANADEYDVLAAFIALWFIEFTCIEFPLVCDTPGGTIDCNYSREWNKGGNQNILKIFYKF